MTYPKISVVVPTYNHARYVAEGVRSILAQNYANLEVLVVDDGSTDNTREVMAQFGEPVRYIWQANRGLSGARNSGIEAATGEYIALLDADDFWEPNFLATVLPILEADRTLGAVHTGSRFVDRDGKPLLQQNNVTVPADQMYDRLIDGEFFAADAVLVRRECFEQVGLFDEKLRASEDWDMWLRVARAFRFAGIPDALLNYRMHGENMSADPEHMMRYQLMVVEKHFGLADGRPETWPQDRQRAYAVIYYQVAQGYYLRGNSQRGQQYLRLTLEANPTLVTSPSLFYELGCADQPLGRRGASAQLNIAKNAATLLANLEAIFGQPDLSPRLRTYQRTTMAHAYLALGTLAYNSGQPALARKYLSQAVLKEPQLLQQRRLVTTLGKSLLGSNLRDALKSLFAHRMTNLAGGHRDIQTRH